MRNPMDVPYRFMLLCAGLLLVGCAGPPRSYPAGDMPMSGPLPLEETLYVTDIPPALTVGPKIRRDVYTGPPAVASTMIQVQRLAFADAMVEIRVIAKAGLTAGSRSGWSSSDDSPRHGGRGGGRGRSGGYGGVSPD